jgi:Ca-activated chloride channel family protein
MKVSGVVFLIGAITWSGLWRTPEQQAQRLMDDADFAGAAPGFRSPMRQGAAWYRAGEFENAEQAFARDASAEAEYNRGNCLIMQGKYTAAVERFDRALELRPNWSDAIVNRDIAAARILNDQGGDMGDQKLGADEMRFDRKKGQDGQETKLTGDEPVSDNAMQAMWLRRVQTKPADFLRAKFSYQYSQDRNSGAEQ